MSAYFVNHAGLGVPPWRGFLLFMVSPIEAILAFAEIFTISYANEIVTFQNGEAGE